MLPNFFIVMVNFCKKRMVGMRLPILPIKDLIFEQYFSRLFTRNGKSLRRANIGEAEVVQKASFSLRKTHASELCPITRFEASTHSIRRFKDNRNSARLAHFSRGNHTRDPCPNNGNSVLLDRQFPHTPVFGNVLWINKGSDKSA